ncbi:1-phosphatidylinositol 4,5-bisphosphate phosphodiesterase gamma-1, partial [Araneus ventricosus]
MLRSQSGVLINWDRLLSANVFGLARWEFYTLCELVSCRILSSIESAAVLITELLFVCTANLCRCCFPFARALCFLELFENEMSFSVILLVGLFSLYPHWTIFIIMRKGIDVDISNAVKNGILYLEDPVDHEKWRPHFFMLTQNKMYYTEVQSDEDEDNEDSNTHTKEDIPNEEIDFGEEWFHGKLPGGYNEAEELLHQYYLGEGSFLVHESEIFVGDYSLSFWRQGIVHHCHIKSRLERGQTKYFLTDAISFDNLHSLITYYQSHQLRSSEFSMCLTEPVPWSNNCEGMEWFHSNMTRAQAEEMLKKVPYDGAYLVRPSEKEENSFAISFRAENKIKHCRIKQDGRLYTIGTAQFVSLVELVNYYEKHTLYRKVKLKYPVNEQVVHRISG